MSEVQTSPAPAAEAAPAESVSIESAVESPAPSGEGTVSNLEASSEVSASATEGVDDTPETPGVSAFNPESWDGNIDSLPDHLQNPVRYLHRQLESGYTKKFQSLADERKAFEEQKTALESQEQPETTVDPAETEWKKEKGALEKELNLLRNLLDGVEDPRVAEFEGRANDLKKSLADMQAEHEKYKAIVDKQTETQARKYAEAYKEKHSEIFDSGEKRVELSNFLQQGWDPEAAAKLVGQSNEVVMLANELHASGTPDEVAVEHAIIKLGNAKARSPRPGARLASGAEGRNNPESAHEGSFKTGFENEDRVMAARAAMNWKANSSVK